MRVRLGKLGRQSAGTWLLGTALVAGALGSVAMAFQGEAKPAAAADPKKDADLPPNIRSAPFEIRDGYRRFVKRCTTCHDQKRVNEAKKSLFEWQGTIGAMSFKKGADIPLEDRQPIFIYLSYLNGVQSAPQQREEYLAFLVKCENCHGITLVYKDKKPLKDWPNIIHRMAGKNRANITPDDEKKIQAYIDRMYPDVFGAE